MLGFTLFQLRVSSNVSHLHGYYHHVISLLLTLRSFVCLCLCVTWLLGYSEMEILFNWLKFLKTFLSKRWPCSHASFLLKATIDRLFPRSVVIYDVSECKSCKGVPFVFIFSFVFHFRHNLFICMTFCRFSFYRTFSFIFFFYFCLFVCLFLPFFLILLHGINSCRFWNLKSTFGVNSIFG